MSLRVCAITATAGRHKCMERSLKFFLNQDYENCVQLIYQNSTEELKLDPGVDSSKVILINQNIDSLTGKPYQTLGAIYRDAIKHVPEDTDVVCFWDDDDIFLRNHISEGVKGLITCGLTAYKPQFSYYRNNTGIHKVQNTMEPSIFVKFDHVKQYGFSDSTTDQHLQWVVPLGWDKVFTNPDGVPTLCYNWGDWWHTYKTSGRGNEEGNFQAYHQSSKDHGDGILTPISDIEIQEYYSLFP